MTLVAYIIGPTNAGKSTLLNLARTDTSIGLVEVGKAMRAKYPPAYFQGQSNPAHTAEEAWKICMDGLLEHEQAGKRLVLIDGQPRDSAQTSKVLDDTDRAFRRVFVHLWAPLEVLTERSEKRDSDDVERLKLNTARLVSDMPANYNVLARLLTQHQTVLSYDTSSNRYDAARVLLKLLGRPHNHITPPPSVTA